HAADQLHIEVAHAEHTARCLAHHRERLGQHCVQLLAAPDALAEFARLRAQRVVRELLEIRLEDVDLLDDRPQTLQVALVLRADDLADDGLKHQPVTITHARDCRKAGPSARAPTTRDATALAPRSPAWWVAASAMSTRTVAVAALLAVLMWLEHRRPLRHAV